MGVEQNKDLVREFIKYNNASKGELTKMRELFDMYYSPNYTSHSTTGDMSLEQYKQYIQGMIAAFPDYEFSIGQLLAEGDKVAFEMSWRGTHKGELLGIPATGKSVHVTSIGIWRIADGKFVESWSISDSLGLMQQLGAIPSQ